MFDENKYNEVNPQEIKEEVQVEEVQVEQAQVEEVQVEQAQVEEVQVEQAQIEEVEIKTVPVEEAEVYDETPTYAKPQVQRYSYIPNEPPAKKEKKGTFSMTFKILAPLMCVVLFISGIFIGVYTVDEPESLESVVEEEKVEISEPESQDEPEIQTVSDVQVLNGVIDVSQTVENVMPSMVSIMSSFTETLDYGFGQTYQQQGASSGSGIIIGENEDELLVATNNHVVEGGDSIVITFVNGDTANAYVKGTDSTQDLAVLSIPLSEISATTKNEIAVAKLGDSSALQLGEPVIAIGNALGYGQSVTTGVVSALNRQIGTEEGDTRTYIQTDAAINEGNSGGALLNLAGEVIGINTSKISGTTVEGIGYAIPITSASPIIDELSTQETKVKVSVEERGYLGVSVNEVSAAAVEFGVPAGVYIQEVNPGSAAQAAGMEQGDIIVEFDGTTISSYNDLASVMEYYAAGTTVTVEVLRMSTGGYESYSLEIVLQSN